MMIVAAARELAGQRVCFVGVGLPNIAVNLAKRTVAPDMELVYEAGVFGARPARLPLSIGDPTIVTGATAVVVACGSSSPTTSRAASSTSASWGRPRSTASGTSTRPSSATTRHPKTRLPGSGGACEIAINARQIFVIMRQSARSFVERIDFRTSPGQPRRRREGGADPARAGLAGARPVGRRDRPRDLALRRGRRDAPRLPPPGRDARGGPGDDRLGAEGLRRPRRRRRRRRADELRLIREELDPEGMYTK